MAKKMYYKLGAKASTFVDPKSGLKIINDHVAFTDSRKAAGSRRLKEAIEGGAVVEATQAEYNADQSKASDALKEKKAEKKAAAVEEESEVDTTASEETTTKKPKKKKAKKS